MTLAEFQPQVEAALVALEWETARARRCASLRDAIETVERALAHPVYGVFLDQTENRARLIALQLEAEQDITADQVPVHPIRSVPMDMIAAAVIRRIHGIPETFPVLGIKAAPSESDIRNTLASIAQRWATPYGQTVEEMTRRV